MQKNFLPQLTEAMIKIGFHEDTIYQKIGNNIRSYRKMANFSAETVARLTGICVGDLRCIENGQKKISEWEISQICKVFHIDKMMLYMPANPGLNVVELYTLLQQMSERQVTGKVLKNILCQLRRSDSSDETVPEEKKTKREVIMDRVEEVLKEQIELNEKIIQTANEIANMFAELNDKLNKSEAAERAES